MRIGELRVILPPLLKGSGHYAFALFGLALLAAIVEGLGFSLVIPLLQNMLASENAAVGTSFLHEKLSNLAAIFPPQWQLGGLLGLLIVLFAVKGAALVAVSGMGRWFSNTLRLKWVTSAFSAYIDAPYARVAGRPQGEIVQTIIGETESAAQAVFLLVQFVARMVQILILFTLLFLADWRVTCAISAAAITIFALVWKRTHHLSLNSGVIRLHIRQKTTDVVSESIEGLRSVKLLDLAGARRELLQEKLREYRRVDTIFNIVRSLPSNVIDLVAIIVGAAVVLIATNILGFQLEAVLPMTALFGVVFLRIMSAIGYMFSRRMNVTTSIPSLRAVHDMVVAPPEQEPGGLPFPGFAGDIVFEKIRLQPPDRDVVFNNLNLRIPSRGMTAIVGPSGSGKTTLVDLLVRLREPDNGRVAVNGEDIRQFDVRSIRARVGYLSQDPQLFNCSIRDNLLMGCPDASMEALYSAARRVGAHDFIMAMPEGYDTSVGRSGVTLSGGQRQRLALARELVRGPDLYIFDEPTSALDHEAEAVVQELMNELSQDHCVILIAHRLATISAAQLIYKLEGGKAVPVSFEELPAHKQAVSSAS